MYRSLIYCLLEYLHFSLERSGSLAEGHQGYNHYHPCSRGSPFSLWLTDWGLKLSFFCILTFNWNFGFLLPCAILKCLDVWLNEIRVYQWKTKGHTHCHQYYTNKQLGIILFLLYWTGLKQAKYHYTLHVSFLYFLDNSFMFPPEVVLVFLF